MIADALARILSLRVDLRDEKACAEISPERASEYLAAKGWRRGYILLGTQWTLDEHVVEVPMCSTWRDYGRRMCEVVAEVARAERRSPLAVWVDMMGLAPGES